MRWSHHYQSIQTTAQAAVSRIESGHRIFVSGNAATPFVLLEALESRMTELEDIELIHVLEFGKDPLRHTELQNRCRHRSLFVGPADREAVNAGRAQYVPVSLHEIPGLFRRGRPALDVAVVQLSPPDEHGFHSLGAEVIGTKAAIEQAEIVIGWVNPQMPRTLGDCFVHASKLDAVVVEERPLPTLHRAPLVEVERRIGAHVAGLIDDGATLQLGIGAIPDAVLSSLEHHRDLGIHTEMVSDGVMEAIDKGIVTGAKKSLLPGKVVATFALGSKRLYDFIDDNPSFEFRPCDFTNDPFVVARNDNMIAINSAIEIDLTGQVCSDSIGTTIYSGFGGQLDFIRGAARSRGGKPIIAMKSTAQRGAISRIVDTLHLGGGVVTTRADVHYVVTEYGVADLHGLSLAERARRLIDIAHPDFRGELERAARRRNLL